MVVRNTRSWPLRPCASIESPQLSQESSTRMQWKCGRFTMPLGVKTYVMAILNVTPDSFSGDGLSQHNTDSIIERALQLVQDGADILDIGGESTRPGAEVVSAEEETRRIVPLVEKL